MDIGDRRLNITKAKINPRDKSTIFSIFPKAISERKVTLFPSVYEIPPGTVENPSSLVVGAATWWKVIYESNQVMGVVEDSETVAKSIIYDYNYGLFGANENAHPGLFYVPEEISVADAKKKYTSLFVDALQKQKNYYLQQVLFADQIWALQQNPKMIGEPMRMAARELGLDKEWAQAFVAATMEKCPACGALRDTAFPVCNSCNRVIDKVKYEKLGFALAEK